MHVLPAVAGECLMVLLQPCTSAMPHHSMPATHCDDPLDEHIIIQEGARVAQVGVEDDDITRLGLPAVAAHMSWGGWA
jgi:hypothetical protein